MTEQKQKKGEKPDPNEWKRFLAATSVDASSGAPPPEIRRRHVVVTIYPEMCRPDTFKAPIEVKLRELDSAQERNAQLAVTATAQALDDGADIESRDPMMVTSAFSMALAKAAIVAVNDVPVQSHEVNRLWEAIGFAGRQMLGEMFMMHCCGADAKASQKSRTTFRIE